MAKRTDALGLEGQGPEGGSILRNEFDVHREQDRINRQLHLPSRFINRQKFVQATAAAYLETNRAELLQINRT